MIECIDGKWYAELWDTDNYGEFTPYKNVELFYTTPQLPELHAKQCHLMKHILEKEHLKRPKYYEWKKLLRDNLRDKPIAEEPWWFQKKAITQKHRSIHLWPQRQIYVENNDTRTEGQG